MVVYGVRACLKAHRINHPTVVEQPAAHELTLEDEAMDIARA
jgi:carbon starvation protein